MKDKITTKDLFDINICDPTEKSNKNCPFERPKGIPPGESKNDYYLFSSMVQLSLGSLRTPWEDLR